MIASAARGMTKLEERKHVFEYMGSVTASVEEGKVAPRANEKDSA